MVQDVRPVVEPYVPAKHDEHAVAAAAEYVPIGQATHVVPPVTARYLPVAQLVQAAAPEAEYLPAAHAVQLWVAVPYCPAAQAARDVSGRTTTSPSLFPSFPSGPLVTCCDRKK